MTENTNSMFARTTARTREMIEAEAKVISVGGHMCISRDWCDTTGPSGCGAKDEKLEALRAEWKTAITEIVVVACELVAANWKWGQVFYQRGFHESLTMGNARVFAEALGVPFRAVKTERDIMVHRAATLIESMGITVEKANDIAREHIHRRTQDRLARIRAKKAAQNAG